MSVNTMSFEQAATILTALAAQATGATGLTASDLSSYISVGQKALQNGYDPLNIGISQMVSRTLFANRPYSSALSILRRDEDEYGAIVRKISSIYQAYETDPTYSLVDGTLQPVGGPEAQAVAGELLRFRYLEGLCYCHSPAA